MQRCWRVSAGKPYRARYVAIGKDSGLAQLSEFSLAWSRTMKMMASRDILAAFKKGKVNAYLELVVGGRQRNMSQESCSQLIQVWGWHSNNLLAGSATWSESHRECVEPLKAQCSSVTSTSFWPQWLAVSVTERIGKARSANNQSIDRFDACADRQSDRAARWDTDKVNA